MAPQDDYSGNAVAPDNEYSGNAVAPDDEYSGNAVADSEQVRILKNCFLFEYGLVCYGNVFYFVFESDFFFQPKFLAITVHNLSFQNIEICIPEYCIQLFPDPTQNNSYSRKDQIRPRDSETWPLKSDRKYDTVYPVKASGDLKKTTAFLLPYTSGCCLTGNFNNFIYKTLKPLRLYSAFKEKER